MLTAPPLSEDSSAIPILRLGAKCPFSHHHREQHPIWLLSNLHNWQQLTIVQAFQTAWAMSDDPGRVGLVIHALLIIAAVCGLLGLILYMPLQAFMDILGWAGRS